MTSQFPLGKVNISQRQELATVLWSWSICTDCLAGNSCKAADCPWPRSTVLNRYFEFFELSASRYHLEPGQASSLSSYEDLFLIIRELRASPELSKAGLLKKLFEDYPVRPDQERALNLAARIAMMVNCSASRQSSVLLEHGNQETRWHDDVSFAQFLSDVFPKSSHPSMEDIKENLRATKLKKHARLNFRPTDDLRHHLRLDRKTGIVEIFHHSAFLKEQLRLTKDQSRDLSVSDLLKTCVHHEAGLIFTSSGALPRSLVIEVLDSIQKILFPLTDPKSKKLLFSLTSPSTCNFDPDILRYDSVSIRNPDEANVEYHYFGAQLADLHQELMHPTPRGFEKWFERNSGARAVMMATIAGVVLAIFLGILSLGLGAFQAYVSYMAWKHPVQLPDGA